MVSTSPKRLPKFHHRLKLTGEGRSTRAPFTIRTKGLLCRIRARVTTALSYLPRILNKCVWIPLDIVYRTYF